MKRKPEYRPLGSVSADYFVSHLMSHFDIPYYIGLLSAASFYHAIDHSNMHFQIIVPEFRRPVQCGSIHIEFFQRDHVKEVSCKNFPTYDGSIRVASPAVIAFDLVGFAPVCGGLNHVAKVLNKLVQDIDPIEFVEEAKRVPIDWVQRLGYLLECIDANWLASLILPIVEREWWSLVPLSPHLEVKGAPSVPHWHVVVNDFVHVESE